MFGPKPRDYSYSMPKRKYRAALQSALSAKLADGQVVIVSNLSLDQPKDKTVGSSADQFGCRGLCLDCGRCRACCDWLKLRAIFRNVCVVGPEGLNVYDIVRAELILILERELPRVKEVWA